MEWNEVTVFVELVKFHHRRNLEKNPGLIAQVDQDLMEYREFLELMGLEVEDFTGRDFFMLLQGLLLCQKVTFLLRDRADISSIEMVRILQATMLTAFAVVAVLQPALLEDNAIEEDADEEL